MSELEEANAALEDMNTQMEASSLQAQTQRDELQSRVDNLLSSKQQAGNFEREAKDLRQQLHVRESELIKSFDWCQNDSIPPFIFIRSSTRVY